MTEEDIEKLQQELEKIFPRLNKLKKVVLSNSGGCNWSSIDFVKDCEWIEEFHLKGSDVTDYSVLKSCTSLRYLSLENTKISKAEDIIGLSNLEKIEIYNTPLAENPQEIKKLQEAYPDTEIRWERKE